MVQQHAPSLGQLQPCSKAKTLPHLPTGFAASPVHTHPPKTSAHQWAASQGPSIDMSGAEQPASLPCRAQPSPAQPSPHGDSGELNQPSKRQFILGRMEIQPSPRGSPGHNTTATALAPLRTTTTPRSCGRDRGDHLPPRGYPRTAPRARHPFPQQKREPALQLLQRHRPSSPGEGLPGILLGGEALGWLWWGEPWDSSRFMLCGGWPEL